MVLHTMIKMMVLLPMIKMMVLLPMNKDDGATYDDKDDGATYDDKDDGATYDDKDDGATYDDKDDGATSDILPDFADAFQTLPPEILTNIMTLCATTDISSIQRLKCVSKAFKSSMEGATRFIEKPEIHINPSMALTLQFYLIVVLSFRAYMRRACALTKS